MRSTCMSTPIPSELNERAKSVSQHLVGRTRPNAEAALGPRMLQDEVCHLGPDAFEREQTSELARDVAAVQREAVGGGQLDVLGLPIGEAAATWEDRAAAQR